MWTSYQTDTISSRTCRSSILRREWYRRWIRRMIRFGIRLSTRWLGGGSWRPRRLPTCLIILWSCLSLARMIIVVSLLSTSCPLTRRGRLIFVRKWMIKLSFSLKSYWENRSISISWLSRRKYHPISSPSMLIMPWKSTSSLLKHSRPQV